MRYINVTMLMPVSGTVYSAANLLAKEATLQTHVHRPSLCCPLLHTIKSYMFQVNKPKVPENIFTQDSASVTWTAAAIVILSVSAPAA